MQRNLARPDGRALTTTPPCPERPPAWGGIPKVCGRYTRGRRATVRHPEPARFPHDLARGTGAPPSSLTLRDGPPSVAAPCHTVTHKLVREPENGGSMMRLNACKTDATYGAVSRDGVPSSTTQARAMRWLRAKLACATSGMRNSRRDMAWCLGACTTDLERETWRVARAVPHRTVRTYAALAVGCHTVLRGEIAVRCGAVLLYVARNVPVSVIVVPRGEHDSRVTWGDDGWHRAGIPKRSGAGGEIMLMNAGCSERRGAASCGGRGQQQKKERDLGDTTQWGGSRARNCAAGIGCGSLGTGAVGTERGGGLAWGGSIRHMNMLGARERRARGTEQGGRDTRQCNEGRGRDERGRKATCRVALGKAGRCSAVSCRVPELFSGRATFPWTMSGYRKSSCWAAFVDTGYFPVKVTLADGFFCGQKAKS
ncbi:hypothetical protein LXA43DRAFT_1061981 [Ganoderma leucocontextum]|nr:hypothetical protein LXA43DRAFT_1061981 [Ganoderma leucocontextum]